jgi:hypothetical protein
VLRLKVCALARTEGSEHGGCTRLSQAGVWVLTQRSCLEWALCLGYSQAYLTTELANFRALRLFRKLVF